VAVLQKLPQRGPETLVFPSRRCTALDPNNLIKRVIRPVCERAGIPYYTWKDFRDTHAALLHDSREPIKIAQAQLGHSDLDTTLQAYTHAVPESQRRAAEKLERVLFPSVPKFEESVH
jgi:integrase